jgi:hypothetical protein
MKHLFAEPSHRRHFWGMIISGLMLIFGSFFFRGSQAVNAQIILVAAGVGEVLMGVAEFFPRNARRAAGVLRISAIGCIAISLIFLILLWTGARL